MHGAWLLPSASCTAVSTVIYEGLEYSFFISALSINVNANVRLLGKRGKATACEYILSALNQILFLFISKTESAIVCPSVIVCILLLLISPHLLTPPTPSPSVSSTENHLWAVMYSHEFTLFMANVLGTATLWASVGQQVSLWLTHAHTYTQQYSCWCLYLVAALKLAHICSSIDPGECVQAGHTVSHFAINLSDSACVCVCVLKRRGWGGGLCRHCPLNIRTARRTL